jgi:hypothetical protein
MNNTQENNKIIAKFMDLTPKGDWFDGWELHQSGLPFRYGAMGNGTNKLPFHESWDWLMEVVEKCLIGEAEHNDDDTKTIISNMYDGLCSQNILQTYQSVVEFINLKIK